MRLPGMQKNTELSAILIEKPKHGYQLEAGMHLELYQTVYKIELIGDVEEGVQMLVLSRNVG